MPGRSLGAVRLQFVWRLKPDSRFELDSSDLIEAIESHVEGVDGGQRLVSSLVRAYVCGVSDKEDVAAVPILFVERDALCFEATTGAGLPNDVSLCFIDGASAAGDGKAEISVNFVSLWINHLHRVG